jgi:hypothetical protein
MGSPLKKEEIEYLKSETKKMFSGLLGSGQTRLLREMMITIKEFGAAADHLLTLSEIKKRVISKKEATVLSIAEFLWAFEGFYLFELDLYCLLLIANGHDLFDSIRRMYASSRKEVGLIDVSIKQIFLNEHGLGMLWRKSDQELRNKIAHQEFLIDENGNISINNQIIDIDSMNNSLVEDIQTINSVLTEVVTKENA